MKVRKVGTGSASALTGRPVEERNKSGMIEQKNFEENLNKSQSDRLEERIALLLADIEEQTKRMANSLSLKELLVYKNRVKSFMEEALGGMYKFTKNSAADRRGRHRMYSLVKRINHELEELTKEMMSGQRDKLKILERADNIRGLLIDLYT
jgi:hypothetical protein